MDASGIVNLTAGTGVPSTEGTVFMYENTLIGHFELERRHQKALSQERRPRN